jgi:hypothetical protein
VNATDAVIAALSQVEQPIRAELFGIERLEQSRLARLPSARDNLLDPYSGISCEQTPR